MIGKNNIKQRLKNKELVINGFIRFPDASTAEIMALSGVDIIVIDAEHYPFDTKTVMNIIRACQAHGAACAMRLPDANPAKIAKAMDMGLSGIMIASVETYEEAKQIVDAVKYAPLGKRGFCPISRSAAYGFGMAPAEYAEWSNENSFIIIQLETVTGVKNARKILSIPEIDIVETGPSDLAASLGIPGHNDDPRAQKLLKELADEIIASGRGDYNIHGVLSDQQSAMTGFKKAVAAVNAKLA